MRTSETGTNGWRTGDGRWSRVAAIFSPGDSMARVGAPNVTPSREASAPPSEWPVIQMLASGYRYVRLLYKFYTPTSAVRG